MFRFQQMDRQPRQPCRFDDLLGRGKYDLPKRCSSTLLIDMAVWWSEEICQLSGPGDLRQYGQPMANSANTWPFAICLQWLAGLKRCLFWGHWIFRIFLSFQVSSYHKMQTHPWRDEVTCSSSWWIMPSSYGYLSIWVRALAWTNLWPVWWQLVLTWVSLLVPSWLALPVTSQRIGQVCRWGRQALCRNSSNFLSKCVWDSKTCFKRKSEMFLSGFQVFCKMRFWMWNIIEYHQLSRWIPSGFNLSDTRSPVVSSFLLFSLIPMTVMRFSTDPDVPCLHAWELGTSKIWYHIEVLSGQW